MRYFYYADYEPLEYALRCNMPEPNLDDSADVRGVASREDIKNQTQASLNIMSRSLR
jgi:hypothetical protein